MKARSKHRFLCLLLSVLMIVSLLPTAALAEEIETSTWEKVELADITAEDTVAITMTTAAGVTYALPTAEASNSGPAAVEVPVSGTTLTTEGGKDAYGWSITAAEGKYTFQTAAGNYLYLIDNNNGVRVGKTQMAWSLTDGYFNAEISGKTRYLGATTAGQNGPDWRSYTSVNNNIKDETLAFWKLTDGDAPVVPTEEPTTEPTTPASDEPVADPTLLVKLDAAPADGDVVYLMHPDSGMVLTAAANGKKLAGAAAEKDGDDLILGETMAALTVSVKDGVYVFALDGKYLTSAETGNGLSFAEDGESDLAKWTLEQQTDGTWYLMNVGAAYNGNHNQALEYFNGFTTYGVKTDNAAYKFAFYAEAANADPASGLKTGDTVAIFNDGNGKAMTATASGTRLAAADAALNEDGTITGEGVALFTVTVNDDGTVTFTNDGKVLTSGATGGSLTLEAEANEYSLWVIEDAGDGLFFIKNANAQYNGGAQYLEYYNTFTTYGKKATADAKAYAMSFRQAAESTEPTPEPSDEPVLLSKLDAAPADGSTVVILHPTSSTVLTGAASGKKLAGAAAKLTEDQLALTDEMAQLKVSAADGVYTFELDGKYLTSAETGNGLSFAEDGESDLAKWTLEQQTDGTWYLMNVGAAYNGNHNQALEYFNGFTTYGVKADNDAYKFAFYGEAVNTDPVSGLKTGDTVAIFNDGNGKAMTATASGTRLAATDAALNAEGKLSGADIASFTVTVNDDGTVTFTNGGKVLTSGATGSSLTLEAEANEYSLWVIEDAGDGLFFIKNANAQYNGGAQYLEYYNTFTTYGKKATADAKAYAMSFRQAAPAAPAETVLKDGDQVVIYNASAAGSLGLDSSGLGASLGNISTEIRDGVAYPRNGAYVFTVGVEGSYYTFSAGGKYLSTRDSEQLFLADEKLDTSDSCALWELEQKGDGYLIKSKTARYNGNVVVIEFFSGNFSGWTFKSSEPSIFVFNFYPVDSSIGVLDDVTNTPQVTFYQAEAPVKGEAFKVQFTLDDLTPIEQLTTTATLNGEPVTNLENDGKNFSFVVPAEVTDTEKTLNVSVQVANASGGSYSNTIKYEVQDVPVFDNFMPAPGTKTGDETMPLISAAVKNASDSDQAAITIAGETHPVQIRNGVISYQPTEPLKEGRVSVKVEVTRADGVHGEQTWSFIVGEGGERLYFGQLHSHTTYSDGSGTLDAALQYVRDLPESANVQFVAFTDHSNYFDSTSNANPEGALYDMSLASADNQNVWNTYRKTVADFNASQSDIVAIAGFEMTWSGGPGHINTFNSPGIVSRNNTTLNNKTNDAGLKAYYALLSQPEGAETLSQFNHPGKTFGNFIDFSYWDAVTDSRMFLVEVGNGEGQIGAGGYYPSYEQYIMALDKGWHVAPTNNQDNHKGRWGNANDARDVILTDDFTEQGIYAAIRAMRVYATEDKNLEVYYTMNDQPLGSTISEVPETLNVNVQVSDPDSSDKIVKVEVVANSGKVVHTWEDAAAISSGALTASLAPDYSYYFIRVTESDGDLAVTAPVWVGETLKLGVSAFQSDTAMPVTGEELTLTTTLFNSEAKEATVKSVTYTTSGSKVLGTDTEAYTVPASGTLEISFKYTPDQAKVMTVTATVVLEQDGKEYTFTKDLTLDVMQAEDVVYIGIDASHYNEYVAGNYKDSMGNFANLAAEHAVRTVYFQTGEELINACGNDKYKAIILTAPSRRLEAAQSDPRSYSDAELTALKAFNEAGGTVVVAGWSDYYENYPVITGNPDIKHMAAAQNDILAALGSSLRISDDATHDDELNGGQTQRLYFSTYNMDNPLMAGVTVDPDHPNDRAYSEVFSHYGGASIYAVDGSGAPVSVLPDTVSPAVYGHASTYSKDSDSDGLGGASVPKYACAEGDNRLLITATEELPGKGMIVVSGAAFMSNFEVQASASSGSADADTQKNYSNYKVCENLISPMNTAKVSDIADVRAETEEGFKFTIEGVVTSNASGYDKDTAFFDCIYVQDETAGICCFPVAGNYKIGDKVRITGTTDFYQGEPELQVISIAVIGEGEVEPQTVTAAEVMDRSVEGKLITVKGTVESYELANGLVQTILVKDENGDVARVFIDGYITTGKEVENIDEGCQISVTGLASYDDTFNAPDGPFPRIRVRDRADVVVTKHALTAVAEIAATCVEAGMQAYWKCDACGKLFSDAAGLNEIEAPEVIAALGHDWDDGVVTKPATETEEGVMTFTCKRCGETRTEPIPVVVPTQPTEPTQPTTPTEPTSPTEPTQPTSPTEPTQPTTPTEPTSPTEPTQPTTPTEPTSPTEPTTPTTPTQPTTPTTPDQPTTPTTPDQPDEPTPAQPDKPDEPTPAKPDKPDTPDKPDKPDKPDTPDEPKQPCDGGDNCPSKVFTDVDRSADSWYHEAVDWAYVNKVTDGMTETTFAPDAACTRAQAVTFLWRANGSPAPKTAKNPFADVPTGEWYTEAVLWAVENGITNGTTDTTFSPDDTCNRAHIVTFLFRSENGKAGTKNPFADVPAGEWYTEAVLWAVAEGITDGVDDTHFAPMSDCTRAHIVTFLYRDMVK